MTNIKGILLQSFSRLTVKCHSETPSSIALINSYFDKLKNQDVSGWHFTFNSLDFLCSENLLGNMKKSSSSDSTLRNQSVADLNQSEDEFWIENDRNTSSCDSQLSLGWSSAGGTDVRFTKYDSYFNKSSFRILIAALKVK